MADDELEGLHSLHGTAQAPRAKKERGLLERVEEERSEPIDIGGTTVRADEVELAHDTLEIARQFASQVTPVRVILATAMVIVLLASAFGVYQFGLPRDSVSVDIVYMQGGGGHVVLLEVHNTGSREVTSLSLEVRFIDSDGEVLGRATFLAQNIPAHTSVAGDDLEMLIEGASVWEEYTLEVDLTFTDHGGSEQVMMWSHVVGEWTSASFTDRAAVNWF
jgi:hypothetical protein